MKSADNLKIISCSIFRYELEKVAAITENKIPVSYFDSYLHIFPLELSKNLSAVIDEKLNENNRVVLICGDCHPFMKEMVEDSRITKLPGSNCVELLIGRDMRRKLMKEGAFFLLPEWAIRWKEIFKDLLELPSDHIKSLLQEQHKKFVYLDSGIIPVPYQDIQECSSHFGLPYEVVRISLDILSGSIQSEIEKIQNYE